MKKLIKFIFISIIIAISFGCTANERAKHYGGTVTINVEPGMKVTNATFKDDQLWYFIEPMNDDYIPQTKKLVEKSAYGIIEGTVIFKESK